MKLKDITKDKVSTKVWDEFFDWTDYGIVEGSEEDDKQLWFDNNSDAVLTDEELFKKEYPNFVADEINDLGFDLGQFDYDESAMDGTRPTQIGEEHPTFIEDQVREENLFSRNAERFGELFANPEWNEDLDSGQPNGNKVDAEIHQALIDEGLDETYIQGYASGWEASQSWDDNDYEDEEPSEE